MTVHKVKKQFHEHCTTYRPGTSFMIIRLLRIAVTIATGYTNQKKIRIHKC